MKHIFLKIFSILPQPALTLLHTGSSEGEKQGIRR